MLNGAVHEYVGTEWLAPGDKVIARPWFHAPEYRTGQPHEGFDFTVQEGRRIVGRGRVLKVINQTLVPAEPEG